MGGRIKSPSLAVVLSPCVAAVKGAYGPGHDLAKSGWTWVLELLPAARTAGYAGSDRNFRRLVVQVKKDWRVEHLVIGWGSRGGVHVFCAVLAWSRWRFVRFAADEKSTTTLAMLGECFAEIWGEVHKNGRQKMETAPRLVDS